MLIKSDIVNIHELVFEKDLSTFIFYIQFIQRPYFYLSTIFFM